MGMTSGDHYSEFAKYNHAFIIINWQIHVLGTQPDQLVSPPASSVWLYLDLSHLYEIDFVGISITAFSCI